MEADCYMNVDLNEYLVIGAGVSGLSVAEYFMAHNKSFRVMDSRELPPNAQPIKAMLPASHISFGELRSDWIERADIIVTSPGISPHLPEFDAALAKGAIIMGDIELFAVEVKRPYIAVTGTNGKSTVTMLATRILQSQGINARACANIGAPALDELRNEDCDMYVLELSSFQLETCHSLRPQAAVVLNICDDHLDRHENIESYASIKSSIYNNSGINVIPRDNKTSKYLSHCKADVSFGLDTPSQGSFGIIEDRSGRWLAQGNRKIIQASKLPVMGEVGELNVLAALALTHSYIKNEAKAIDAISAFEGLPHRCQLIAEYNNVKWIDDSKGTNIGATVSAINGLKQPLVLILGGIHKGGSLDELVSAVQGKVSHVIAFGQDKQIFIDALNGFVTTESALTIKQCVALAQEMAVPGHAVLFSPACASFDMFSNYIERGLAFQNEARKQIEGGSNDRE